jgi:hypothetical protein
MQKPPSRHTSWRELLSAPGRGSHVLQLYDSHDFLTAAVAHFAAEGLRCGEAIMLSGTAQHLAGVRAELARSGVDAAAAARSGQLTLSDVNQALDALTARGPVERAGFDALVDDVCGRMHGDPRFGGFRWWAEYANTVHLRGDERTSLLIEEWAGAAAARHGTAIFCSALCDRFDARGYDGILRQLCCTHTHVIPAEDYVGHRLAVNRAIAEVVGEMQGSLLQSLSSWKGLACELPSSQALLFWLRESLPEQFGAVVARARAIQPQEVSLPSP